MDLSGTGLDFTQHSRGSRAKTKQRQYGVVLGRRGSGRGALLIDMVTEETSREVAREDTRDF